MLVLPFRRWYGWFSALQCRWFAGWCRWFSLVLVVGSSSFGAVQLVLARHVAVEAICAGNRCCHPRTGAGTFVLRAGCWCRWFFAGWLARLTGAGMHHAVRRWFLHLSVLEFLTFCCGEIIRGAGHSIIALVLRRWFF